MSTVFTAGPEKTYIEELGKPNKKINLDYQNNKQKKIPMELVFFRKKKNIYMILALMNH